MYYLARNYRHLKYFQVLRWRKREKTTATAKRRRVVPGEEEQEENSSQPSMDAGSS